MRTETAELLLPIKKSHARTQKIAEHTEKATTMIQTNTATQITTTTAASCKNNMGCESLVLIPNAYASKERST